MSTLVVPFLSFNVIKIATRICQFSQYLGTKLDMLFEIAKSDDIVIILGKTAIFYHKIFDFMQKHYSIATFVHTKLPQSQFFSIN